VCWDNGAFPAEETELFKESASVESGSLKDESSSYFKNILFLKEKSILSIIRSNLFTV
jgi:hypothetical protein